MAPAGYREYAPGPALARAVECFWSSAAPATAAPRSHRVLPDGCMDILFDFRAEARERVTIVGTMSRALLVESRGATDLFAIRFRAGGLPALLGLDAAELRDRIADLGAFAAPMARELWERLAEAPEAARPAILAGGIEPPALDPLVAHCAARIEAAAGALPIAALARDTGVSGRRIERRFARAVGLGPKAYARVVRFRALAAAARAAEGSWADLAARFGYSDQPHMVREFRAFAGVTPTEFLADPATVGFVQDRCRDAA
jgi:AraC-like DNA-binding protein